MRVLVQRVSRARVTVDGIEVGAIGAGLVLLTGIADQDTHANLRAMADKLANLRIFEDAEGKMNRSILDRAANGEDAGVLVVSQFTLYGDVRKGRRPSFTGAARPEQAAPMIAAFAGLFADMNLNVATGKFGAHMDVALVNDGPVTIWIDSDTLKPAPQGNQR